MERDIEKEVIFFIGLIYFNIREVEFKNLKRGLYSIFLEIYVRRNY